MLTGFAERSSYLRKYHKISKRNFRILSDPKLEEAVELLSPIHISDLKSIID